MYSVEIEGPRSKQKQVFADKPAAMHCAVQVLTRFGPSEGSVSVRDENGTIVFSHEDILRTCATVRP